MWGAPCPYPTYVGVCMLTTASMPVLHVHGAFSAPAAMRFRRQRPCGDVCPWLPPKGSGRQHECRGLQSVLPQSVPSDDMSYVWHAGCSSRLHNRGTQTGRERTPSETLPVTHASRSFPDRSCTIYECVSAGLCCKPKGLPGCTAPITAGSTGAPGTLHTGLWGCRSS